MVNIRNTPSRSQGAQRVVALALLASFSACSHGGEPRHSLAREEQQLSARAAASAHKAALEASTDRSKHGVIRSAKTLPEPEMPRQEAEATFNHDTAGLVTNVSSRTTAPLDTRPAPASGADLPDPRLEGSPTLAHEPGPAQTPVWSPASGARTTAPAAAQPTSLPHEFSYWPLYVGAGIAALSILVLALLRRRDHKTAQVKRDAELVHAEQQERVAAAAREEAQRLEQQRVAQATAEAAAKEAAEQKRTRAAAAHAQAQNKADSRIEAARRLFDLLHRAERDVEPFLQLLDEAAPRDATTNASREVVASWHESMLSTRNRLSEALARHNAHIDMPVVEPALDLASAMSRLIDHAARMSALMVAQQQDSSAILHWSRQLPGALIQLFWRAQTARYTSSLPQLPKVPDSPAPGAVAPAAPAAPVAATRPARVQDKAIQQALRGGQSHVLRT